MTIILPGSLFMPAGYTIQPPGYIFPLSNRPNLYHELYKRWFGEACHDINCRMEMWSEYPRRR